MPRIDVDSEATQFAKRGQAISLASAGSAVALTFTFVITVWLIWGIRRERQLRRETQFNRRRQAMLPCSRDMSQPE